MEEIRNVANVDGSFAVQTTLCNCMNKARDGGVAAKSIGQIARIFPLKFYVCQRLRAATMFVTSNVVPAFPEN